MAPVCNYIGGFKFRETPQPAPDAARRAAFEQDPALRVVQQEEIGAATRSLAKAALFSAVSTLLLLHASGVFRTPLPGSFGAAFESVAPFRTLHEALLAMSMMTPVGGGTALGIWCFGMAVTTGILAGRLSGSLGGSGRA